MLIPTIGRIVHYKLGREDADKINKRRADAQKNLNKVREDSIGYQLHVGNSVREGQEVVMMIVQVWSDTCVNGRLMLDGNDTYWVTSAQLGESNTEWDWMDFTKKQEVK